MTSAGRAASLSATNLSTDDRWWPPACAGPTTTACTCAAVRPHSSTPCRQQTRAGREQQSRQAGKGLAGLPSTVQLRSHPEQIRGSVRTHHSSVTGSQEAGLTQHLGRKPPPAVMLLLPPPSLLDSSGSSGPPPTHTTPGHSPSPPLLTFAIHLMPSTTSPASGCGQVAGSEGCTSGSLFFSSLTSALTSDAAAAAAAFSPSAAAGSAGFASPSVLLASAAAAAAGGLSSLPSPSCNRAAHRGTTAYRTQQVEAAAPPPPHRAETQRVPHFSWSGVWS